MFLDIDFRGWYRYILSLKLLADVSIPILARYSPLAGHSA